MWIFIPYLSKDSLAAAIAFYNAVEAEFSRLADAPHIGRWHFARRKALHGLRVWRISGFERMLVFYVPTKDGVRILRVLHGARDLPRVLEEGR